MKTVFNTTERRIILSFLIYVLIMFILYVSAMIVGGPYKNFITAHHIGAAINMAWLIITVVVIDKLERK